MANPYALDQIDQPAAANDSGNPYAITSIEADGRTALRGSLISGQSANPDQTAEAVKLARKTGSPYEAIQANLPEVQQGARLDDYEKMLAGAPATRRFLTAPQNAAMANDDVGGLTEVEKAIRSFIDGGVMKRGAPGKSMNDKALQFLSNTGSAGLSGLQRASAGVVGVAQAPFDLLAPAMDPLTGTVLPENPLRRAAAGLSSYRQGIEAQSKANMPKADGIMAGGYYSGIGSLASNLATMPLALFPGGQGAAMAGMTVPVGGGAYGEARDKGINPAQAAAFGTSQAVIEYATEKLPLSKLIGDVKAGTPFFKTLAHQIALEVPGEQLATVLQDLNEWAVLNPDKPFKSYLEDRPNAAAQTLIATIVGAGGLVAVMGAVQNVLDKTDNASLQRSRAEEAAAGAENIVKAVAATKLVTRDADSFQEFVNQVAEDSDTPTELFIDATTLTNTLNQAGITMERLAMVAPAVAAQLRAASFVPGADIRVPVAEFAAAGADITTPLIDHLRETPDAMSRAEAQEYMKTEGDRIQADVETELGKMGDSIAARQQIDAATARFEAELTSAGRFRPEVNKAYASLMGNFYGAQAARAGMPLEDFLNKYQLRVTGKTGQGAQTLEQTDREFKAAAREFTRQSRVKTPVYHATSADFTAFDTDGKSDLGAHFGTTEQANKSAGRNRGKGAEGPQIMPVYLDIRNPLRLKDVGSFHADGIAPQLAAKGWLSKADAKRIVKEIDADFKLRTVYDQQMRQLIKDNGYDSVVYKNTTEGAGDSYIAFEPTQIKSAIGNRGTFDRNDPNILNQGPAQSGLAQPATEKVAGADLSVAGALLELGKLESLFQYPKSTSKDIEAIAADKGLQVASVDRNAAASEEWMLANTTPEGAQSWMVTLPAGQKATVVQDGQQVYINVSAVGEGNGGSAVYDLAANYAANNGLTFIGDPNGVSPAAMRRRLENMLSSAIKYGTTDHLQPHPDQLAGNADIGVPALKWTDGDTEGNILSMVEASVAATESTNPVATENVSFDPASQSFVDGDNNPLDAADLRAMLDFDERAPGTGQAGVSTLQRNALFRALLSGPDARRAFLDAVRGQQGQAGAGAGATRGTFYQGVESAGAPRATLNFASDITQAPSVIALLEGADLSSFLHESGHFFLEVQADLATRIQTQISAGASVSEAERGIVADMNTLLAWFGVTDMPEASALDQWAMKTLEERREAHETFARGFERYAMEGKAPTQELAGLFNKFRSWLVSIYQKLANLNVTLTDDVRGVMDRMLASDEAIAEAQAARNMGPLFQSPEQAGMTPKEYDTYQFLGERATAAASEELDARLMKDMKWLSRAKSKAIKAAQAEADDIRRDTEREVRGEVMAQPVYRAWAFLTGKQDPIAPGTVAPADITGMESGKLRTSLVKNIDAEAWSRLSERRMTSEENGMDPDLVAEVFEFTSGDELVRKLAAAPPPAQVIAEQTDQLMMERYGDITSAEALSQAADEAVHNELRARVIATELKALQKAGQTLEGNRNTTSVLAKAAKEYAAQVIARQRVRDLRPSQYTAAETRSAKLAEQALGKDMAEAALHKRNQLINNYAARAAYDAQDEVKAMQAYFRKFDKRRDSIDAGYQDQIEALLERFDFKPASLKAIDKRKSFAAWYEEQAAGDNPPDVPEYLLDEASRKSYKDMTVEELRGLRDTVKQIEHQGRLKNKLLLARDQRDFDAAATAMANSIIENGGEARPVQLEGPNPVTDWFAGVAASHRKLASLFRQMDGNKDDGPMYDLIGRGMNERGTMEDVMVEKATVALRDIYALLMKMRGGITGARSKLYIPEINASLTRGGRLAVALNWGNEANRQRIMDGDKWSQGQVQAILKTLTPVELKFVNDIWAYIDSYWEDIAAKEKRLTGVEPEKVQPLPFAQTAADGTEVQMRGGYYPLKYDTDRSDRADTQEAAQAAKEMMQGVMTRSTTRRGHTKERLKEVKRAVRKDLNVITQHITQVTHDLAWHEWLIDTNKLLQDGRVVSAIRDHYGPRVLKTIRDDVLGIATADVVPQDSIDKALLKLRGNVTRATMGASITTAFLQPFGLTQSMVRIGPQHVLRGMARWGGDAVRMENTVEWIRGKSEFMRLRAKTFNKELREIRGSVAGKSATMRVVDAGLFALMQKMQLVADVPTWIGQYEKSLSEGLDEAAAVAMADRAVLESQGGGATKDLAEVQRKHPMLTQFYSYFSVTMNLAAEQTAATDFKNPAAVAGWLGDMALLMVIPAILPPMIMYGLKGGDDDDEKGWAKRIAQWQLGYLMGTIVGIRELSGAVSGFDYAGPPVGRIVSDIGKAGKQTAQGELDEPAVMAYIKLMGTAFGIPVVQALRSYKGWKAWDEGQEGAGPQSVLFGPPPKD